MKGFIIEILVPILLILIGFSFSKVTFFFDSPERPLSVNELPLKQRILANGNLVQTNRRGDISPEELLTNLPDYEEAFEITYKNYTQTNEYDRIIEFD